ncbi:MAG: hypothetical protein V1746_08540, partial [bacterium]
MTHQEKMRGFYSLAALGLFAFFLQLAFYTILQGSEEPRLYDADAYMRLVRVEELHQTGDWFSNVISRSNAPYGESLHWTRPLDVLLLAGAWLFHFFTNFHHALLLWGIVISPLLQILGMGAMVWAIAPFMKREYLWHAAALFLWTPATLVPCVCGRPDHHSLLVLLFVLEIGCALRLVAAFFSEQGKQSVARFSWILGGLLALSMWISVESLAVVALCLGLLAALWQSSLINPRNRSSVSSAIARVSLALFIGSCVALALEKPFSHWGLAEVDCLSVVHLSIFGFFALCGLVAMGMEARLPLPTSSRARFIFAAIVLAGLSAVIGVFFPDFFRGPYAHLNPLAKEIWLKKV